MQVCFTNLGCKLNQAELEALARSFTRAGHRVTGDLASADLHVVNTCTVTHVAERDSRKVARRGRRLNPSIRTVLTGCYAARDAEASRTETGADMVVANHDKAQLLEAVHTAFPELAASARKGSSTDDLPYARVEFGNARALVKIEDGCNMSCAFCIIPTTRGRQQSRPGAEISREVEELAGAGFPEVVLTGVQISSYRWRGTGLFDLVRSLLETTSVRRLRLTSIAPWQFDSRLLDLFDSGRLCRHVHLSLQSGSTRTLERMRRPYSADEFASLVARLHRRVPGIAITTDVIAGFPGETDPDFEQSLAFVQDTGFARVHAFPFSARPGTEAATLPGQVEFAVKKERTRRLRDAAEHCERLFLDAHLGKPVEVLWECERNGLWHGTSDNYLRARTRSGLDLSRRMTRSVILERRGNLGFTARASVDPGATRPRGAWATAASAQGAGHGA